LRDHGAQLVNTVITSAFTLIDVAVFVRLWLAGCCYAIG